MLRVSYKSVLQKATMLYNGQQSPSAEDAAALNEFIRSRVREFWNAFFWPEWLVIERREFRRRWQAATAYVVGDEVYFPTDKTYYMAVKASTAVPPSTAGVVSTSWAESMASYSASDWSSTTAYALGAQVYQPADDTFYQCIFANTNHSPQGPDGFWTPLVPFVRDIDFQQAGDQPATFRTVIQDVKKVWDKDPLVNEDACPQNFTVAQTGIVVRGKATAVWVEFRLTVPEYSGTTWISTQSYNAGEQVYETDSGDYWVASQVAFAQMPSTSPTFWTRIDFPYVLAEAVAHAAFADMLRLDGQLTKSAAQEQHARYLLMREFDRLERQQGQTTQMNVQVRTT